MTDHALHFSELKVYRVHGVPRDQAFSLPNLSPCVNLIYGPNASGKSTTARVIQELLWPGRTELDRPSVAGQFRENGHQWSIDIDAGYVQTLRNGEPGNTPQFGPPENRHRYHLALHELIQQENRNTDFAKQIADASQGGYDLNAAAEALDYRDKPPGKRKDREALENRRAAVNEARERQASIEHEAQTLKRLREDHVAALEAERTLELLKKAQDYRNAVNTHREIEIEIEAIPEGVTRLHGNERNDLNGFAEQQKQLENDQSAEEERIKEAEVTLQQARLHEVSVDQETFAQLRGWQRQLMDHEIDIRQHQRTIDDAVAIAKQERRRLGDYLTDAQLVAIDRVEINDLDAFAPKVEQFRAERALLLEKQSWLQAVEPEAVTDVDTHQLHEGIAALARWLATPPPLPPSRTRPSWILVLAATIIVGLAIVLAITHHIAWGVVALLAPVFLWLHWQDRRSPAQEDGADDRRVHRGTFEQTDLTPPASWEITDVVTRLSELAKLASIRALEDERARRRADLTDVEQNLAVREQVINEERATLQEQLGIDIAVDDLWLSQLLKRIDQWQNASNRAIGAEESLRKLNARHADLLQQVNADLDAFGYQATESAESVQLKIEDLDTRWQKHKTATATIADAQRRLQNTIRPAIEYVAEQRAALFERLQLEKDQEPTIDDWLGRRAGYLELQSNLSRAAALRDDRKNALSGHEGLLDLTSIDLQQRINKAQAIADKRDELHTQIVQIERDIEQAEAGHTLTDALRAYEAAIADLEKARDQSSAAVVGNTLTNWVRQVAVDQSRPDVFDRANEILGKFTKYTLKLNLDDHAMPPAFRAQRSTGEISPVDELSVGERVQLLMAVRVAFIEHDEITRLPLLLDETLGTSDDDRAGLIIDSVIELARGGRQIFYFTAQHDEVAKWRARLEQFDVPHRLIDLAAVRSGSVAQTTPLQITPVERPEIPASDGLDYTAYGQLLSVPGINPATDGITRLHLWHLMDDANQLYSLLSRGISTWGQLRLLHEYGDAGLVGDIVLQRADSAARAIDAACEAWRIGRGRPVDRQVLLESGSVSDTFINSASDLANQLNGDAGKLIEALESKRVPRWRQENTESLRGYFTENGYLTHESPLDAKEIRVRVLAVVSEDLQSGRLDDGMIDRIIGSLSM